MKRDEEGSEMDSKISGKVVFFYYYLFNQMIPK